MVTREQLEAIEATLTRIGLHIDGDWAIGGTTALCINDPSDVRVPLSHGYSGDLIAMSQTTLREALAADPTTNEVPEATAMCNDPLAVAFQIGATGAIGVAYAVQPDHDTHALTQHTTQPLQRTDTTALRSLLLASALGQRATVDGLSGSRTIVLTPGGVAISALASSIVTDSRLSQDPSIVHGPATMAAEGAPEQVADVLTQALAPITLQLRRGAAAPHKVLAGAIRDLLEYANNAPLARTSALPALQDATAQYLTAFDHAIGRSI